MPFWDWLTSRPTKSIWPAYSWEARYRDQKARSDELAAELDVCQSEKFLAVADYVEQKKVADRQLAAIKAANDNISRLTAGMNDLAARNRELQAKVSSMEATEDERLDSCESRLTRTLTELAAATNRQTYLEGKLATAEDQLKEARKQADLTPERLKTILAAGYAGVEDVSKVWDDYAAVLIEVFAVKLLDPVIVQDAGNYKADILNAFPGIRFNSDLKDNIYYRPSSADAVRIIRNDFGNLTPYVPEQVDCDKFAERLRVHFYTVYGLNIGIEVWGDAPFGRHAWFLAKCSDGIVMCEPQNDYVAILPETIDGYIAREIVNA